MVVFNLFCLHVVLFDFLPWAFRCKMVLLLFTCVRLTERSCCYHELFPHNRRMLAWWRRMVKLTWRRRQACGRALCSLLVSYLTLPTPPPPPNHHHHHPTPTPHPHPQTVTAAAFMFSTVLLLGLPCIWGLCVWWGVFFFFSFFFSCLVLLPLPPFFFFFFFLSLYFHHFTALLPWL